MAEKRYYWLKLKDDFFNSIRIKKLRSLAGGDTYTIIYLKMLLKAIKNDGIIEYQGIENNICDEIALDIDESPDNVSVALTYLLSCGLAEQASNDCLLPEAVEMVGSETASAQRGRDFRKRQKALRCNNVVAENEQKTNVDIDIDIEKDIEIEKDIDIEIEKEKRVRKKFTPPTLAEVQAYCHERHNNIDAEYFIDYYQTRNWELKRGVRMKDWKAAVRTWERNNYTQPKTQQSQTDVLLSMIGGDYHFE